MAKAIEAYWNDLRGTKVWRSVFRSGAGANNLHRSLAVQQNVFLHLASVKMRRRSMTATRSSGHAEPHAAASRL